MDWTIKSEIEKLHKSDLYGRFIENGGPCIVAELLKIPGASNTIYRSEIPYAKEIGNLSTDRSVSKTNIWAWLNSLSNETSSTKINFDYVSSFQLSEKSNHGYIGINRKNENSKIYHISVNDSLSREYLIDLINKTSIKLINGINVNTLVDGVWNIEHNRIRCNLLDTLKFISKCYIYDSCCYISPTGEILRLEDFIRSGKNIVIYKGSFNPIHNGHLEIINHEQFNKPDTVKCFSISIYTFEKGQSNTENLKFRIECINKCGYGVLIYNQSTFEEMIRMLRLKISSEQNLTFPLGADTWRRLVLCYGGDSTAISNIEKLPADFVVFERQSMCGKDEIGDLSSNAILEDCYCSISSSQIRRASRNCFDDVKLFVPECIQKDVENYYRNY